MPYLDEGNLRFIFSDDAQAEKYDAWEYYKNGMCKIESTKGVDFVIISPNNHLILIEVKDYRQQSRDKPGDLLDEFCIKIRDTLAGLRSAHLQATEIRERDFARNALNINRIEAILYIASTGNMHRLFPRKRESKDIGDQVRKKLKRIVPRTWVWEYQVSTHEVFSVREIN